MPDQDTALDIGLEWPTDEAAPLLDLTRKDRNRCDEPMSHPQLLDRIITVNPNADIEYLGRFSREKLADYLDHLLVAAEPRGRGSIWVRRGDTAGVVTRVAQ